MMLDLLLALGLLLSTTSQLRPRGAPIGPGEILLVVWLLVMLCREAARRGPLLTPALCRLLIFWALFACAQSVGTMAGFAIGDVHDPKLFLHDVMAYPLLAAVSCMSVAEPGAASRLQRTAWFLATLGTASLALQLTNAWGFFDIAGMDPWYWDRLRGWSENPNQLAILCLVIALLSLHLAESATQLGARIAALASLALATYAGRLTKSDTFGVVLVAAGPIFVALKLRSWLLSSERRLTIRSMFAWTVALVLPIALISAAPLGYAIGVHPEGLIKGISKDNGESTEREALLRLNAWRQAMSRGLESGMLGLGPGPHLDIPASVVAARKRENEPKYVEHPEVNFTRNFEAHNTPLDLFTQGGLIAVLSFVWLATTTFFMTYRAKLDGLTTLICGLAIFSIFHLIVRHPLFWFATALCLVAGIESRRTSVVRSWS
jgi:hypothetical protein